MRIFVFMLMDVSDDFGLKEQSGYIKFKFSEKQKSTNLFRNALFTFREEY